MINLIDSSFAITKITLRPICQCIMDEARYLLSNSQIILQYYDVGDWMRFPPYIKHYY